MRLPEDFSPEERGRRAGELFREGYNCCQAVVLAFADLLSESYGLDTATIAAACSGFGGGMARMREVCGSFSGCVMMAGFISPASDTSDHAARGVNYALVQQFAGEFRKRNGGSIVCRELLGIAPGTKEGPMPSVRTPDFYRKRPCAAIIENAARIVAEHLLEAL